MHVSVSWGVLDISVLLSTRRFLPLILVAVFVVPAWADESAEALYRKGFRAQRQGRHIEAYVFYSRARALDPANVKYVRASRGVRRGAAQLLAAAGEYRTAIELAPDSWEFQSLISEPDEDTRPPAVSVEAARPLPRQPAELVYSDQEASFQFRGTAGEAYEAVGEEFGVRVVFDRDFDPDSSVRADLSECDFGCAMRTLGAITGSLAVPLESDLVLLAPDQPVKRAELETAAFASIPLDGALTPEEITEVGQAVQQVLDLKRFQSTVSGSVLFLRDSVAKVGMARTLASNLLHPKGELHLEITMIMVSGGNRRNFGADLPTSFPVTTLGSMLGPVPAAGAQRLVALGGGETAVGVSVGDASVFARLEASSSETLQSMSIRVTHGVPAEFKVGERFPITTAQYSGGFPQGGAGYIQPPPSITFEDLGLNLAVTPYIHTAVDATLQLEVDFRLLAGGSVNDVPILSNREFTSHVRLRRGQFAIVSGMAIYERRKSSGGIAGLGSIPWLGNLFRTNDWQWNRSDLLVLVRPTVVRLPPGELTAMPEFLFGSEERPLLPL